ncbi:24957_t:CDS:2, partial [Gigaspora rosea]
MSSIFVSFCFAKTVRGGEKYIARSALYRTNISLVQAVPILSPDADYVPTPADLPNSSPLLLCSATVIPDSPNSSMQSNAKHPSYTPRFTDDQNNPMPSTSNTNTATHNNNESSTLADSAEPFTSVSSDMPISHQTEPEPPKKRQK